MKKALVCGAGGFIGGHLVKKLKKEGYWIRGVDIKEHELAPSQADSFLLLDLRRPENCGRALMFIKIWRRQRTYMGMVERADTL
ncbi:MAG: NAD-dependent epimerase/dehydratase family protein [Deltaproteobacteria bacterium]|nr:NAD-dependent epimerase/dehydratase family protein [Deltaproteobacteria bacterium]